MLGPPPPGDDERTRDFTIGGVLDKAIAHLRQGHVRGRGLPPAAEAPPEPATFPQEFLACGGARVRVPAPAEGGAPNAEGGSVHMWNKID